MNKVFEDMVAWSDQSGEIRGPIAMTEFEHWKNKEFTFDALHGLRYGQSFCSRFNITDNLLYYAPWSVDKINNYIVKNYIARS